MPSVFPSSATLKPIFWMSIVKELLASRVTVNVAVPVVRLIRFEYSVDPAWTRTTNCTAKTRSPHSKRPWIW